MQFLKQFLIFLILIFIISFIDYVYIATDAIGIDDGNIFLNYAQHIAHGQGFVFNTNGEKVEGFTSFLWVLICAAAYLVTAHPELLLICFSLLLTTLVFTNVFRAINNDVQKLNPRFSRYFFLIYCAFIITTGPSFLAWSVLSLMENALWNFIFTSLVILTLKTVEPNNIPVTNKLAIIILACLLSLTRPEALVWNLVFTAILFYTFILNRRKIYLPIIYFVSAAITTIGLTIFRLHYFGFRFPNTYYAKISPDKIYNLTEGARYALDFLAGYQPVISFLFVLMIVVLLYAVFKLRLLNIRNNELMRDNTIIQKFSIVSVIIIIGFVLPCTTGGDHFGGFRFYQHLLPLFSWGILIIAWLLKNYKHNEQSTKSITLSVVVIFFLIIGLNDLIDLENPAKTQLNYEFLLARQGRDLASQMNESFTSAKPSTGMIAVGGFGLIYQGETVDLMGLNNISMGHSPGDRKGIKNHAAFNKDVFYKLKPDILLPEGMKNYKTAVIKYYNLLDVNNFNNQAMKNIFNDGEFKKIYTPVFVLNKTNNTGFFAFVRNNYISSLKSNSNLLVQSI